MFGRDDHPFALLARLDTRSPAFHHDDACAVDAGASPNVDITSALHAVRFDARPCMIGSSTGAMRAESLSGLLCTGARRRIERLLHLNVVLPRPITGAHRRSPVRVVSTLGRLAAMGATDRPFVVDDGVFA